ncbi:MAG: TonB-dependent receptor [Nitrospiraceae bacterium]|nr:MAG: TonB-dependent receptor [Nitrospiraceae bacterium]
MKMGLIFFLLFCNLFLSITKADAGDTLPGPPSDLTKLSLEELMEMRVETVYGASKYEQKLTEAPSSVSIVTSDEIKKYGYRSFAEVLRSIRGFQTTNDRNYSYLNVRGFGLPGDYNSRILLLIDGHRINDNIYNAAALGREFPLEIDLIDRIEVVRGPGSSLYGSNAFFAVINVITRRGRDLKGVEVSGEAGSFSSYKGRLSYGNTFDNGPEMLFSGSYYDSKGNRRLFYSEFDDPSTNNGIAEDLDYERYGNLFGEMTFQDFTLQGNYNYRKKGVPTASYETLFNNSRFFTVDEQFWADLKYAHTYPEHLNVLARVNYNYYKYYGDYPLEGDPAAGEPEVLINKDYTRGEWFDSELQFVKSFADRNKVILGAYLQYDPKQVQRNFYINSGRDGFRDKRNSHNWALYTQGEIEMAHNLVLNAGLRYDHYKTFGGTINPRAALIYSPFDMTAFKLVYGRAFRAPNVYELYYHDGSNTQKPGLDLEPEVINTYEAIYEQYLGENYRATVTGFFYRIDDLIALQTDSSDGLLVFRNVDEVEAKGMEFELGGEWKCGTEGRVSYTFQETENRQTGDVLPNSAKHLAKLNVVLPLIKDKLFLGLEEQYTSRRRNVSGDFTGGFFITNLTFFSRDLTEGLELSASVYNVFDKKYVDPASETHRQGNIEQDGATGRVKATYKF